MRCSSLEKVSAEAELISQCRRGQAEAWDFLFDQYYGVVARFIFQLSADFSHEDTEEICQETFVSVVHNLASFQAKSSFQTWLLRIASNKAMDFRAKTQAAKRGGRALHLPLHGTDGDNRTIDPPSSALTPDAALLQAENFSLVRQCLDRLEADCRELIELSYYGDLSYAEIADDLRLNPKTVSSRLSRCLDRLGAIAQEIFPREKTFAV